MSERIRLSRIVRDTSSLAFSAAVTFLRSSKEMGNMFFRYRIMNIRQLAAIQNVTANIQTCWKLYINVEFVILEVLAGNTVDSRGAMVNTYERKSPSTIDTYITAATVVRSDTPSLDTRVAAAGVRPDPGDSGALALKRKLFPYTYDFASIFKFTSSDRTLQIIWEPYTFLAG